MGFLEGLEEAFGGSEATTTDGEVGDETADEMLVVV